MKHFKLKIEKTFTNDHIAELLCTAFEGGITDTWCRVVKKTKPKVEAEFKTDMLWNEYELYSFPLGLAGSIKLLDTYENKKYVLNRAAIQRRIEAMAKKHPYQFGLFVEDEGDAITADVFLQCCLFGEEIYG
jgi:hypothetical protein